ncbi:hypothetical protein [Chryseobacterium indoltheticum]|uniref:Uncharacterized protein n=1 Tax=Chryseobacterium indoltheticum TaxID=254 RepID=A0A381FHG8_9FLAO|nr:hypothetical protein [Chryseobacterium indoltheticum]AZA74765.1 hypothetical protein EG358_13770 [Chryseobacterium indoltheticum]SIQ36085.1 hypothetical protein SAMN05421682_104214 [Chryseobacterium indoltheticum]SUX45987.1 Uncharacterised protein [Chryseobacterium indoltheticum]
MITREEYLKALETVRKYREQVESKIHDSAGLPDAEKFLSEYDIPYRLRKVLGEIYLFEISKDFKNQNWESCYKLIKISDLKTEPFILENILKWRGMGGQLKFEVKKIYKSLGTS